MAFGGRTAQPFLILTSQAIAHITATLHSRTITCGKSIQEQAVAGFSARPISMLPAVHSCGVDRRGQGGARSHRSLTLYMADALAMMDRD